MNRLFDVITVSGSDASAFLQGQLTQDVTKLHETPSALAAWCNPKGRVITVMRLLGLGKDQTALVVPAGLTEFLIRRLLMFKLRARVEVKSEGGAWVAVAVAGDDDLAALDALDLLPSAGRTQVLRHRNLVAIDVTAERRCVEVYGPQSAFRDADLGFREILAEAEWQLVLIEAGIPLIQPATSEKYTPHMLNLDRLGAISFNKGCYTGQEVVARTEHLGKSKRRLMRFRADTDTLIVGDKLRHEDREVGEVVNVVGRHLLGVVPVELHDRILLAGQGQASPVALPYALPPL